MSHQPERKDKDCLNCGTIVQGRYCHVCGQQNVVTKQSFWALLHHFVEDITHFDSKFFDTVRYILFRPGYLSKQYMLGRRASYLDPIRMYLFTSAVFFLIFFSVQKPESLVVNSGDGNVISKSERLRMLLDTRQELQTDSTSKKLKRQLGLLEDTTNNLTYSEFYGGDDIKFSDGDKYQSAEQYDSIQKAKPAKERDSWLNSKFIHKKLEIEAKYKGRSNEFLRDFIGEGMHRLPYLLFISLPFFALILKLLYVRRKSFYYTDHIIFTLHQYIFSFLLLLIMLGVNGLQHWLHWGIWGWIQALLGISWFVYSYLSLRNFYGQKWFKTFVKFLMLNFLGFIVMMLLLIILIFFSIFQL